MTIQSDPDTEPLRIYREQGLSTREIAKRVNMSQSTVSRKLRQLQEAEQALHKRQTYVTIMFVLLTGCALVIAAAVATLAWG